MAVSPTSPRHLRHRKRSRVRRSKDFKSLLTQLQAALNATGAAIASWTAVQPVTAVAAAQTLTASAIANGDTITIGSNVYLFQDTLTAGAGHVKRSGTLATDLATLAKAINLTGVAGTDYGVGTAIHPDVSATSDATHLVITAKVASAAANTIATTETGAGTAWAAATMAGGVTAVAATASLAKATHGLHVGDGPYLLTNSGGALPTPLAASKLAWVATVPDSGHFTLAYERGGPPLVITAAGSGTNTMTKASSLDAVYALLKRHGAPFMKHATDVDGI